MAADVTFKQGDSLWSIAKKILLRLNQSPLASVSAATEFAPGDMLWHIKRKTLTRLLEMFPAATGDVQPKTDDSVWSLERKILQVLNQMTLT